MNGCGCGNRTLPGSGIWSAEMASAGCIAYQGKGLPQWSNLSGSDRCDTAEDALNELKATINALDLKSQIDDIRQGCVDVLPSGCKPTVTDTLNAILGKINLIEARATLVEKNFNEKGCLPINN
jgi:hypothetical protein